MAKSTTKKVITVKATDVKATDVKATDVKATDVKATDVKATVRQDLQELSIETLNTLYSIVNVSIDNLSKDFELASKTVRDINNAIIAMNEKDETLDIARVSMRCPIFRIKATKEDNDNSSVKGQLGFIADCFNRNTMEYKGIILRGYGIQLQIKFGKNGKKNSFSWLNKLSKNSFDDREVKRATSHKNAEVEYCKALNLDTISEERCQEKIAFGLKKNLETYINQVKDAIDARNNK